MNRRQEIEHLFGWHETDKLSHGYAMVYDKVPKGISNLFEIGIGGGHSIRAWLDIFPHAKIHCLDIGNDDSKCFDNPRISAIHADINNYIADKSLPMFDLVVDDGGHDLNSMLSGWRQLHPFCSGMYVIEDVDDSVVQQLQDELKKNSVVNSIIQTKANGGSRCVVASFNKVIQW